MCDVVGNELKIGDKVVYVNHCRTSSHLVIGVVDSFTSKKIYVHSMYGLILKEPTKVVKYAKE